MAFDSVRDRLRDEMQTLAARIQETSAWNQLVEKYQDLNPTAQKLTLGGSAFFLVLILFLFPWMFYSSSLTHLEEFESKKATIRELYRVSRAASALPAVSPTLMPNELRSTVQSVLDSQKPLLKPEQIAGINEFDNSKAASSALPKGLSQNGVSVSLSKLNLDQVVRLGAQLQSLRPTVKMTDLRVQALQPDPHYFDVTFKLVSFSLPPEAPTGAAAKPGAKPAPAPKRPAAPSNDDE